MPNHNYQKLEVYRRSVELGAETIKLSHRHRPYRLSEQLVSSAISIASNIAEGALCKSDAEFKKFLRYSSGSAAELSTQLTMMLKSECYPEIQLQVESLQKEAKEIMYMCTKLGNRL